MLALFGYNEGTLFQRLTCLLQQPKLASELSDLVVYCQAVHFKDFQHSKDQGKVLSSVLTLLSRIFVWTNTWANAPCKHCGESR